MRLRRYACHLCLASFELISRYAAGQYDNHEALRVYRSGADSLQICPYLMSSNRHPTAHLMKHRENSVSSHSSSTYSSPVASKVAPPPPLSSKPSYTRTLPPSTTAAAAPPPYPGPSGPAASLAASNSVKRAPPPPPAPKPRPAPAVAVEYCTALYDYAATAEGDLSFAAGDRIELVKRTESTEDWWTGRLNGYEGSFPAN